MHLFQPQNAELLVSVSRLSLQGLDRMLATMPPGDAVPSGEIGALVRLISNALNYGVDAAHGSNGQTG